MDILGKTTEKLKQFVTPRDIGERLEDIPNHLNEFGYDEWGMHPDAIRLTAGPVKWLFEKYFRVEIYGIEKVPAGRLLMIPNHSGQLPFDGLLLFYAMLKYGDPPRILRAMVERFVPRLPFISTFFARCGQVVGAPANCRKLLENDEAVLVFPEGARGSGKLYWKRYQLQKFGTGFMRLALETKSPIVPVAVIGAEEIYPAIYNLKSMAKLFKAPYFPITPFFPWFGPLGMLPLPSKIRIYFGDPMTFTGDVDEPEYEVEKKVEHVAQRIQKMIHYGLRERKRKIDGK